MSDTAHAADAAHDADSALVELGLALKRSGYHFITVTPESHRRVNQRPGTQEARSLRDVFGWSRPFRESLLSEELLRLLRRAGGLRQEGGLLRSAWRFSSVAGLLCAHSAYPTTDAEAVFFGPDTYRFVSLLRAVAAAPPYPGQAGRGPRIVEVGCGSGAGGLALAQAAAGGELVLADINEQALRLSRVNALINAPLSAAGDCRVEVLRSDVLNEVAGAADFIVANPPYLVDDKARLYRDGGGELGTDLSVRIVREGLERLTPRGALVLYTGAPIVAGEDVLWQGLSPVLRAAEVAFRYEEIDPDVFGEELDKEPYAQVERIAVVALTAWRPGR